MAACAACLSAYFDVAAHAFVRDAHGELTNVDGDPPLPSEVPDSQPRPSIAIDFTDLMTVGGMTRMASTMARVCTDSFMLDV